MILLALFGTYAIIITRYEVCINILHYIADLVCCNPDGLYAIKFESNLSIILGSHSLNTSALPDWLFTEVVNG
jgi:hypothetical protein